MHIITHLPRRHWRFLAIVLLVALGVFVVAVELRTKPPLFMVLRPPFRMPVVTLRDRIDGWVPRRWTWLWRLEAAVFGRRKPVNFFAEIVALNESYDRINAGLFLSSPAFSATNGLQVWLLDAPQVAALHERLNRAGGQDVLSRPRIITAEGVAAEMFTGVSVPLGGVTNHVGVEFQTCGWLRPGATEVVAWIRVSELVTNDGTTPGRIGSLVMVRTNLDTALRLRIPNGKGMFLVDGSARDSTRKRVGVLLEPPQPKR